MSGPTNSGCMGLAMEIRPLEPRSCTSPSGPGIPILEYGGDS